MLPCTFPFPSTTNRLHSPLPALTLPSSPPALYHQDSGTSNQCLLMSFVQLIHSTGGQQLCVPALRVCHISEHAGPFPTADTHGVSPIFLLASFSSTSSNGTFTVQSLPHRPRQGCAPEHTLLIFTTQPHYTVFRFIPLLLYPFSGLLEHGGP